MRKSRYDRYTYLNSIQIKGEGMLGYLKKRREKKWKRLVKFKLGNEMKDERY